MSMRMRVHSTIAMLRRHQMISLMLLLVAMLSGCASEKAETEVPVPPVVIDEPTEPEPVSLLLACAPANANQAMTRLADDVVQLNDYYRKITNFRVVALKNGEVSDCAVDNPSDSINHYSEDPTKADFRYYHSHYCSMAIGVDGCLVYAKADNSIKSDALVYNGSLNAVIPNFVQSTDDIYFEPVPIYDDVSTVPAEATALGNALTSVVNAVPAWSASQNSILQSLYSNFINRRLDIPGSAASVKQWMLSLSDAANAYLALNSKPESLGEDEIDILGDIKTAAATAAAAITVDASSYPRNINLPDGAAALRWTEVELDGGVKEYKFVPQLETTTLDNINSVSRFVYPPALYYFVDSELRTSNQKVNYDGDNGYKDDASWSDVLARFTDGGTIQSSTKTVAVADPLQYAVAQLQVKVKANAVNLKYAEDAGGDDLKIDINDGATTNYFRLTGVIIDGQRPVDYQFQQTSNLDSDVKFVFDSQVPDDFYLTTTAFDDENAKTFNTLVLQSYDGEDVKIILEFEYVGKFDEKGKQLAQAFKCQNGYVYPGTRFYLVGELKMETITPADPNNIQDYEKRVFTQDRTTQALMTVTSLEKAYNVLPSILSKNLEIGVMTTPKWIFATPPDPVIMD